MWVSRWPGMKESGPALSLGWRQNVTSTSFKGMPASFQFWDGLLRPAPQELQGGRAELCGCTEKPMARWAIRTAPSPGSHNEGPQWPVSWEELVV